MIVHAGFDGWSSRTPDNDSGNTLVPTHSWKRMFVSSIGKASQVTLHSFTPRRPQMAKRQPERVK
jgi:hypothetical protein